MINAKIKAARAETALKAVTVKRHDKIKFVERRKYETSSHSNRLRNLKKSVMRMLQIASNPRIINDPAFHDLIKSQGLGQLIEEASPKFLQVCELARSIAEKGEKVIIWSGFRENIKLLESQLADLEDAYGKSNTLLDSCSTTHKKNYTCDNIPKIMNNININGFESSSENYQPL